MPTWRQTPLMFQEQYVLSENRRQVSIVLSKLLTAPIHVIYDHRLLEEKGNFKNVQLLPTFGSFRFKLGS